MKIGVISDIHGNLEALEAVIKEMDKMKIQDVLCAGDLIGYGANPNEVTELIRNRRIKAIMGNHDYAVANLNSTWFNQYAAKAIWWTIEKLEKENSRFIKTLPERIETKMNDYKIFVVHGSPRNPIWEYVYPTDVNDEFIKNLDHDVIIMGHTHIPFVKNISKKLVLNPGSVGQPRGADPRASFAVIDLDKFSAKIVRVDYDLDTAAKKIIEVGLPDFLALRLYGGI